jgi:anaerobic ribonucleoside-triphosphate reductase activating protein
MDISNGEGIRVSIFVQGCSFKCEGCFNPETHDFNGGKEFNTDTINRILELCSNDYIVGLSILGGEPLHPKNIESTTLLAKTFKEKYPSKNIWIWTGFLFDKDLKDKEILNYIDVLVDGQFNINLYSPRLSWKGSSNQRVIDVKKSLNQKKVVLYEKN